MNGEASMNEALKTAWDYISIILLAVIACAVIGAIAFIVYNSLFVRFFISFLVGLTITYAITKRVARMYIKNDFPWQRNKKKD
jgi:hypothetical protein